MIRLSTGVLLLVSILITGCGGPQLPDAYRMDKRYWDVSDYQDAVREIKYRIEDPQMFPRLSDPLTASVFKKLVDIQNIAVILEDETLGIDFRQEQAEGFFEVVNDVTRVYQPLDKQDKYIHPMEFVELINLNLYTQLLYFKIGNESIIKDALDPESKEVRKVVGRNAQIVVDNFEIYIEKLAKQDAYSSDALNRYAQIIDLQYSNLIKEFPSSNYSGIKRSTEALLKKIENQALINSLNDLVEKIRANKA